jgi:hypothetical protein
MTQITLDWPSSPLSEKQWRDRMEATAEAAEKMIGRTVSQLQLAQLVMHWIGVAWPAISAETIAASCRASLLVGAPGVVVATAPADQLAEIHERLDRIWEQAQADPAAAVLEVHPPLIDLPPLAEPRRRRGRRWPPKAEAEPAADPEPLPAPAPAPRREPRALRPASERMAARPAPAPEPEPLAVVPLEPELSPPSPPPPGWLLAPEVAELLDTSEVTIGRWRSAGKFGADGEGWAKHGGRYYYSPDAVELLMAGEVPPGLDQLLADVQAA